MFNNLITSEFKQLFKEAIDTVLAQNSLSVPCLIRYDSETTSQQLCNNCKFDPITLLSSNIYNGTGPISFLEGQICPVCLGSGYKIDVSGSQETIHLGVIFDSKYWLNWSSKTVNLTDGMVQTICSSEYINKIRNAKEIVIDSNLDKYGNYTYERAGDPNPCGFGNNDYIITMWKRQ